MNRQITDLLVEPKPWRSMPAPRIEIFQKPEPKQEPEEPKQSKHYEKAERAERREMVLREMRIVPEQSSEQIAKKLGLPRGTILHDIWYLRDTIPELRNFGRKKSNRKN